MKIYAKLMHKYSAVREGRPRTVRKIMQKWRIIIYTKKCIDKKEPFGSFLY